MHESVRTWVASTVAEYNLANQSVLEIGSLDVNGNVRDLFTGPYLGIDLINGPNVDRVMDAHDLSWYGGSFDVVLCLEMIEHDPKFWITLIETSEVLVGGGHLLLTTRGNGFPEHNFPSDYWRFMPASAELLANLAECYIESCVQDMGVYEGITHTGILLHGIRK